MTVSITHTKVVTEADNPNKAVGASEWNDEHVFEMATARVLGRTASGTGAAQELTGNQVAALATSFTADDYKLTSSAFNAQTGTTYTLLSSDNGKIVTLTNAASITLTVPAGLGAGFSCMLIQGGNGQVTVTAGGGATVNSFSSFNKLAGRWACATLVAPTANSLVLSGAIAA